MKRRLIALLVASIFLIQINDVSNAAVKAGSACTKLNSTSTSGGYKYTCIKSGKKLVWSKGIKVSIPSAAPSSIASPTPTPSNSSAPTPSPTSTAPTKKIPMVNADGGYALCGEDNLAPSDWSEFLTWASLVDFHCTPTLGYLAAPISSERPKSILTSKESFSSHSLCKLPNYSAQANPRRGFPMESPFTPTVRANIQVLAVSFADHPSVSNPMLDHAKELDYFTSTLRNAYDLPVNPVVTGVDHYIQIPGKVEDYKLYLHQPDTTAFKKDVLAAWDPSINFSNIDYVMVVVPTSVVVQEMDRAGLGFFQTSEKAIRVGFIMGPLKSDGTNRNAQYTSAQDTQLTFAPGYVVHEGIYHMLGLDDHPGDEKYRDPHQSNPSDFSVMGTGEWGNMSGMQGELLTWDKWTAGLIADSQVKCAASMNSFTAWLNPSSTKGLIDKLVVIPTSTSTAIVVESRRSTGYNYKYPKESEGLLVYTVDTFDTRYKFGVTVLRPKNRPDSRFAFGMQLGDAALKLNEFIDVQGYRIQVIESGEFGEVIKVTKA